MSFLPLAQEDTSGGLIDVVPGLMIWTLICFAITFYVLKRFAFGPIQRTIDERRERIRKAVEEADEARAEARGLLEQHRAMIAEAKGDAAEIRADARKVLRGIDKRHTLEAAGRLRDFSGPTMLAWATEDRFFKPKFAERLKADIPGSHLEWIEDSRTFVSEDQPERLASLIGEFANA